MSESKVWARITAVENIPLREGRSVEVGGHDLAIFNLGNRFLAVENRCPHRGGPLADGIVSGSTVVCPLHAWKIDLMTGGVANRPENLQCVRTFQTRVEDGVILVEVRLANSAMENSQSACFAAISKDSSLNHSVLGEA
jgi:nitrite reductase (NADH) small subunit